jgi:hypothetical protein
MQTLGIPFRTLPRKKTTRIPFRGTKIPFPNHSTDEKTSKKKTGQDEDDRHLRIAKNEWMYDLTVWMIVKNNKYKKEWHNATKPLNTAAENFKNSVRKDYFWGTDKSFCWVFWLSCETIFSAEFCSFPSELWNWLFRGTRNASEWALSSME